MEKNFFSKQAFSLIDLMVALAIATVLMAASWPSLIGLTSNKDLRIEANKLETTIEDLILKSSQAESDLSLILYSQRYQIVKSSSGETVESTSLKPSVSIALEDENKEISFYSSGVNSPASIILKSKGRECRVILSLRGRVRTSC